MSKKSAVFTNAINPDQFYRLPEIKAYLGVSRSQIYKLMDIHALPPWDRPFGPKISGYWGRTLIPLVHEFQIKIPNNR